MFRWLWLKKSSAVPLKAEKKLINKSCSIFNFHAWFMFLILFVRTIYLIAWRMLHKVFMWRAWKKWENNEDLLHNLNATGLKKETN